MVAAAGCILRCGSPGLLKQGPVVFLGQKQGATGWQLVPPPLRALVAPHAGRAGRAVRPGQSGKHLPGGAAGRSRCVSAAACCCQPFAHACRLHGLHRSVPRLLANPPILAAFVTAGPVPQPFLLRAAAAFTTRILSGERQGQCSGGLLWRPCLSSALLTTQRCLPHAPVLTPTAKCTGAAAQQVHPAAPPVWWPAS